MTHHRHGPTCDYCGLPLGPIWPLAGGMQCTEPQTGDVPQYCCFGCRFAAGVAREGGQRGAAAWLLARLAVSIFLSLNVMVFTMALWSHDLYGDGSAQAVPVIDLFRYLCLVFAAPVVLLLGAPLAESAWTALGQRRPSTDLLLVAGVAAAFIYSVVSVLRGEGYVYFEVACGVLVMVTLGRWLEAAGRLKTTEALDALGRLLPDTVYRVTNDDGNGTNSLGETVTTIPLDDVSRGDLLRVRAGERIPADGRIRHGVATIDEQLLTGESRPVEKQAGEPVVGGTLNLDGRLLIEVAARPREGTLQRLIDAVHAAQLTKGHYQILADRVAGWFLPLVAAIALAALLAHGLSSGWDRGLLAALAVVLIACPCALGLATPLAVWSALGTAARQQVVCRHGAALERLAEVDVVAFDKTGTLTTGLAEIVAAAYDAPADEVRRWTAQLCSDSYHPLARALAEWAGGPADLRPLASVRTLVGQGIQAELPTPPGTVWLGSPRWFDQLQLPGSAELQRAIAEQAATGRSLVCIGWSGRMRAVMAADEQLRGEAAAAIADCRRLGLNVVVLTGDHAGRGADLAEQLQVPVRSQLLPEDKVAAIAQLRAAGHRVAMIGDGINDAPALAAADCGLALGCGADVSRESADVCLLGNDLRRVAWTVELARRTVAVIRQNLFWAFAYNVVGVGLACLGWLNPILAAAAMLLSSVLVVGNSLRLAPADEYEPAAAREPLDPQTAPVAASLRGSYAPHGA